MSSLYKETLVSQPFLILGVSVEGDLRYSAGVVGKNEGCMRRFERRRGRRRVGCFRIY